MGRFRGQVGVSVCVYVCVFVRRSGGWGGLSEPRWDAAGFNLQDSAGDTMNLVPTDSPADQSCDICHLQSTTKQQLSNEFHLMTLNM